MESLPLPALPDEPHLRPGHTGLARRMLLWLGISGALFAAHAVVSPRVGCVEPATAFLVAGGLFLLLAAGFFLRAGLQLRAFTLANAEATALVYEGHFDKACVRFEANTRRFRSPSLHPISIYNLADTLLQRGELERALSLAAAVATCRSLLKSPLISASAPSLVATCYALLGDLDSAKAWLPEARRAAALISCETALVPEVIVACREGRFAEAVQRMDERRRQIDGSLAGNDLRILRAMRAFALAQDATGSTPQQNLALALARPAFPGELDYLATRWPELGTFLKTLDARESGSPELGTARPNNSGETRSTRA